MAQLILVTSGKGGVGKSAVCACLGEALAALGRRVAIVEGSHRSLDVAFGISAALFDLGDALEGRCEADEALLPVGGGDRLRLLCGPLETDFSPDPARLGRLCGELCGGFDLVLAEADGARPDHLAAWAGVADRAVIVSTPDPVAARAGRRVSDALDAAGVEDIRLCVNMLPREFARTRPVPDLDWMIDSVCAQLVSVVPWDKSLAGPAGFGRGGGLSILAKMAFDNFAQRILGNYIDLLVQ